MDPFSQPCSFQNLLNSQQPNTSFSFVSRQPSIELYASDASVFATQWHEDANEDAHRRKLDDQSAQSSSFVPGCQGEDEAMTRHVGVKAAKARGKSKAKASEKEVKPLVEFQSIWEIRQKDFVLKEKLNKQKLLDSLIAKTETLSELEIALKNKLINDMLAS
ncbi:hypothetical protein Bca4012_076922 [Brassica carinata]